MYLEILFFVLLFLLIIFIYLYKMARNKLNELEFNYKSMYVKHGKNWENFVPFMNNYPGDKENSVFIGNPIDFISFDEDNSLNKERKIRYNNLGFNIGNIIRLKGRDKDNLETHFNQEEDCVDCLIDLNDRSHQLSIVLFGKAIPIVGNGDKDERFIQALVSKAVKRSQYYLALELPSSL